MNRREKSDWRELLKDVNIHKLGEEEALRRLCNIGRYFPEENDFADEYDRRSFESSVYGRMAEILGVNCDIEFSGEDLVEIEAHLKNGKTVGEIAHHCFHAPSVPGIR